MNNRTNQLRHATIKNSTKVKAYQDLIDWVMKYSDQYHVVKSSCDQVQDGYQITITYRALDKKRPIKTKYPIGD